MTASLDQLVQGHPRVGIKDVDSRRPSGTRAVRLAGRTVDLVGGVGSARRYFICPDCGARRWHLYLMPAPTCRVCAHLDYASDRIAQRSRTLHRVVRLRQQIPGADPWPHGRLPKFKRHYVRRQRLVDRVRELEDELVANLHAFCDQVEKRARQRRR